MEGTPLLSRVDGYQSLNIRHTGISLRVPEIPVKLQPQPEICGHPEDLLQTERSIGSDSTPCPDDFVETGI